MKKARRLFVFVAGAGTLFVELTMIRYVPGQIRVLGYFTNFVLLAAFLGFGLGILAQRRWPRIALSDWAPLALVAVVGLVELGRLLHVVPSPEEFLFLEYSKHGFTIPTYPFLTVSFLVLAVSFVPLGYVVGQALSGGAPLYLYGLNLGGSLFGIALFALFSAFTAPPWVWVAIACGFSLLGVAHASVCKKLIGAGCAVAATVTVFFTTGGSVWSPYHKLTRGPVHILPDRVVQEWKLHTLADDVRKRVQVLPRAQGSTVHVNDDSYQTPLDLSDQSVAAWPGLGPMRRQYDLPFMVKTKHDDVLVLGAGTGNDVAGALRAGAKRVDAVEIDREILKLGLQHPENPYSDPRVTAHVADARTFLTTTRKHYDVIVFGLVDSHVLLNATSPVRLDSFVFTKESFELARSRLKPTGVLLVSHAVGTQWFFERMHKTLASAFGKSPQIVTGKIRHPLGIVYAAGDTVRAGEQVSLRASILEDDWPFVYLKDHKIPSEYLVAMLIIALASIGGVRLVSGRAFRALDRHFFFLGAGFLLIETRGVTVLAVHLGSTWGVNAAVFAAVLSMALIATWVGHHMTLKGRWAAEPPWSLYGLLGFFLVMNYVMPMHWLASLPFALRAICGSLLIALPLFASGLVYAINLARTQEADRALASNLLGAMLGGLMEYVSMVTGFRALILLSAVLYLAAMIFDLRARQNTASG